MPSYKTVFGSTLKAEDIGTNVVRVVVESVAPEVFKGDDGKETRLMMHFVRKDKALSLNRTNCLAMEDITGSDDYDSWPGHVVELFVDPSVMFGGKRVGGVRIRAAAAKPKPKPVEVATADEPDDAIPF